MPHEAVLQLVLGETALQLVLGEVALQLVLGEVLQMELAALAQVEAV
jgi:hypothetical protein